MVAFQGKLVTALSEVVVCRCHRETKEKLVAYRGKLVTVQEALGESPNGSGFVITLGAAPGLDATNLVVGRVVGGMDLVRPSNPLHPHVHVDRTMGAPILMPTYTSGTHCRAPEALNSPSFALIRPAAVC